MQILLHRKQSALAEGQLPEQYQYVGAAPQKIHAENVQSRRQSGRPFSIALASKLVAVLAIQACEL